MEINSQEDINGILNKEIDGIKIRDMSPVHFCRFCISKLNNVVAYSYKIQELTKTLNIDPEKITPTMFDDERRIDIINKLKDLNLY